MKSAVLARMHFARLAKLRWAWEELISEAAHSTVSTVHHEGSILAAVHHPLLEECRRSVEASAANGTASVVNYTLRADGGLYHIDVINHASDYEQRLMPLQWAIDQAVIALTTDVEVPAPMEWPFSQESNEDQDRDLRLSYVRGIRNLLSIAFSWHTSLSLLYFPAWTIVSIVWSYRIFTASNPGLIFVVHILFGLSLASFSLFVAAPFARSPQLAAVVSTFASIVLAIIALVYKQATTASATIFSLVFPPAFYMFAIRAICGWENHERATDVLKGDPDNDLILLPLIIVAIINVFLWSWLATVFEALVYNAHDHDSSIWFQRRRPQDGTPLPEGVAISIRNLGKTFNTDLFRRARGSVTAIADLSMDVPKNGITVLLGSNGAGKSTALAVLAGLTGRTRGTVTFEGGHARPPWGTLGIVPQKNVLFPELSCYQTVRVWRAIKWAGDSGNKGGKSDGGKYDEIEQLLHDCDLGAKVHANADTLSGGQKRKLQLAAGLIGGSKVVLVDEYCTSGVDPLSRRAIWRTLTALREERTIVYTTHFLDEADLLADEIAILAAPGKLVANGPPVALKQQLGEGYAIHTTFDIDATHHGEGKAAIADDGGWDEVTPEATLTRSQRYSAYRLHTKDITLVELVVRMLDERREALHVASYDIHATSIEEIFLDLMTREQEGEPRSCRAVSPLRQAVTIFRKRLLIARRSWLTPALAILVAILASIIPLETCVRSFDRHLSQSLYLANSPVVYSPMARLLTFPSDVASALPRGPSLTIEGVADNETFMDTIRNEYKTMALGGVSVDLDSYEALFAWEASPPGKTGLELLNEVSNILYQRAVNATGEGNAGAIISASYSALPSVPPVGAFFGVAMAVYPAFLAIYVAEERRSLVQAMQFSNGLSNPVGLWLGHVAFDAMLSLVASAVIALVFSFASTQFEGEGLFVLVMFLYGLAATLFSYCISLMVASPLAAFAVSAGYQVIMFVLYLAGYLLTLTYAKTSESDHIVTIIHFTLSLLSPVANVARAGFVSVNLFSLLCSGGTLESVTTSSMGNITHYGGPIAYLFGYNFVLFAILVWVDSGSVWRRSSDMLKRSKGGSPSDSEVTSDDVLLRVENISKTFGKQKAVDSVSLDVPQSSVLALLGANGGGKTTTLNVIRGDIVPDEGDAFVKGVSIVRNPSGARLNLGVCPQFTAIDTQLTVRDHLLVYARLKGLSSGAEINENVDTLLQATRLDIYADRLASKLSGGNQRKLSLAIALMGNPAVILIDEFSTGVDAKMKRDMWQTLKGVSAGKPWYSMEEASALADYVTILAKRTLASGTIESLSARYACYEVHFTCRTREDAVKAQVLMAQIPGSRKADDVATRFEIPIGEAQNMSLADVLHTLSSSADFTEYTVEKTTLESVFLKVMRDNKVGEEDDSTRRRGFWCW
ncbi:P-loop containing nucleoside triphosphate hydrolase protein [Schizophyllum amplum]|uniref:P-loop containing nucleoside triphosphate hydrolase protein n=1 Tax=Schizophyllum amplum TaxID=97359 RepID=A0A550D0A0_9AGAR|nr:P-loop containing nucleoside triphosphate hydrolase protein [Auriculariopsis ampla]